jgi:predicted MFS family arabinose efflux permease
VHIIFSFNPDFNTSEIPDYISSRYLTDSAFDQNSIGLTMLFFGIRDFCMIILINLVSKKKRANFSSTIYLIMVYLILPYLLKGNGLADFLSPFNSGIEPASVMIGIVEAALAVYAVIFVWRKKASIE